MTAHTKTQREYIALRLARFDAPNDIVAGFRARWADTLCTIEDVYACDPAKQGILPPDIYEKFLAERQRILLDPLAAPTSNRKARLIILHRMFEKARDNNQVDMARGLLAAISMEAGSDVPAPPGGAGPVQTIVRTIVDPAAPEPAPEAA